ncbi:MAG TPA: cysteine desulfurase family protein [Acidimicrobiales bacterium]|nr:cysteine desulfurase family protein [Acidimicrobiales bacterium]
MAAPLAYLDHAATTPLRPEALEAMLPYLTDHFGNPSGSHAVSRAARAAVDSARATVATALGCQPGEVVFTGGGTEADNLALAGVVAKRGGTAVCSAVEHHAVLHATHALGGRVTGVGPDGVVDLDALVASLDETVSVVSVMLANNEVGIIQPLAEVAAAVRRLAPHAVLHTDAVQAFPWLDVATLAAPAALVAVSAHKFGGPKGVGALVVRAGTEIAPILHGGGQERDRRSGTHNVAGIVAMAAAMQATVEGREATNARVAAMRDRLADGLLSAVPGAVETGARANRIAGSCHLRFPGIESEALLVLLDDAGICASAGSACASGALEPSHVLAAMGVPRDQALASLRLSLGATTTDDEIDLALKTVPEAVAALRGT